MPTKLKIAPVLERRDDGGLTVVTQQLERVEPGHFSLAVPEPLEGAGRARIQLQVVTGPDLSHMHL